MKHTFFALVLLCVASPALAASASVLTPKLRIGETLVAKFSEMPERAAFLGEDVPVFPYRDEWRAIAPVPLGTKAGSYVFEANFTDGTHAVNDITVRSNKAKTIVLPPPPKLGLSGTQIVQNLAATNQTVRKIAERASDTTYFNASFGLPLSDNRRISSPFGEVRRTGEERITHMGVDFDNPKGRLVAAINGGIVTRAYADTIYGNTVIIDHGRGIYSLYMHLDAIRVKDGDAVRKGTIVGTVGDSGLASGPHLHLSIKIAGVSVDPIQFVSAFR